MSCRLSAACCGCAQLMNDAMSGGVQHREALTTDALAPAPPNSSLIPFPATTTDEHAADRLWSTTEHCSFSDNTACCRTTLPH